MESNATQVIDTEKPARHLNSVGRTEHLTARKLRPENVVSPVLVGSLQGTMRLQLGILLAKGVGDVIQEEMP